MIRERVLAEADFVVVGAGSARCVLARVLIRSDEALDAFVATRAESAYHPCGTCRMGDSAAMDTVVDPTCRVVGVDGLRAADLLRVR